MRSTSRFLHYVKCMRAFGGRRSAVQAFLAVGLAAMAALAQAQPAEPAPAAVPGAANAIVVPKGLEGDVRFWIRIYTEVTTDEGLLHDERNLDIVYGKIRVPQDLPQRERIRIIDDARDHYANLLRALAARPGLTGGGGAAASGGGSISPWAMLGFDAQYAAEMSAPAPGANNAANGGAAVAPALTAEEQRVLALFGPTPLASTLLDAARTVRFQLGQADRFRAGLQRSGAWEAHIAETLANLGLPPEIAALPHVESSFNPAAYSKVGAAGLWQFMRGTGKRYMRVDDVVDERLDPFRSSEAAAQLMAYNFRLLGSWPLAITAYNHGAAGMRRAQEALGTSDYLAINRNFRGPTFGFASRNFFPSFLAALTIDRNPERYFGVLERAPDARFHEIALPAYVSLAAIERATAVSREQLRDLNPALRPPVFNGSRLIPRGYRLRLPARLASWNAATLEQRVGAGELYAAQITPRSHVVARGETLARIARRYGLSTAALAERNGLASSAKPRRGTRLSLPEQMPPRMGSSAGQALLAAQQAENSLGNAADDGGAAQPAADAVAASAALVGTVAAARAQRSYIVRRGDTAFSIAQRFGLSAADLLQFNGIRDADFVFEGQQLRLTPPPPGSEPAASTAASMSAAETSVAAAAPTPAPTAAASPASAVASAPAAAPAISAPAPRAAPASKPVASAPPPRAPAASSVASAAAQVADEVVEQADADDYSVAKDGSIRVIGAETLGHYADWLGISASRLRSLNKLKYGEPVRLGRRLRLDFTSADRAEFEKKRRAFHAQLQAEFFESRRIVGTEVYILRRGDTLWSVTQRYKSLPVWLLQQYNPDVDLADLRAGTQLVVPKVE